MRIEKLIVRLAILVAVFAGSGCYTQRISYVTDRDRVLIYCEPNRYVARTTIWQDIFVGDYDSPAKLRLVSSDYLPNQSESILGAKLRYEVVAELRVGGEVHVLKEYEDVLPNEDRLYAIERAALTLAKRCEKLLK